MTSQAVHPLGDGPRSVLLLAGLVLALLVVQALLDRRVRRARQGLLLGLPVGDRDREAHGAGVQAGDQGGAAILGGDCLTRTWERRRRMAA